MITIIIVHWQWCKINTSFKFWIYLKSKESSTWLKRKCLWFQIGQCRVPPDASIRRRSFRVRVRLSPQDGAQTRSLSHPRSKPKDAAGRPLRFGITQTPHSRGSHGQVHPEGLPGKRGVQCRQIWRRNRYQGRNNLRLFKFNKKSLLQIQLNLCQQPSLNNDHLLEMASQKSAQLILIIILFQQLLNNNSLCTKTTFWVPKVVVVHRFDLYYI